ncbi:hypothetical protein STCU_05065 [Strigomonas culicis]|uniref:Uncharacterized protein n=1 Tax=Strigomonas culicis TaxID=28005 RepID=S9VXZ3_9TRYP|nr:hypothetical protein STCU_05065 [Strigomonas culicis]|eukprot:EPY28515.1 hypothetical protein STCU_05065 [Strigomonas culicis]
MIASLKQLRRQLHQRIRTFEETRAASREAAQQIGWYAVSAQWRDQVLHRLLRAEEEDWSYFGELERYGGSVIFPNYALNEPMAGYLLALLRKLDKRAVGDVDSSVLATVQHVVLPLLQNRVFPVSGGSDVVSHEEAAHWARARRRTKYWFEEKMGKQHHSEDRAAHTSGGGSIISPSFLFPLQCTAELLELCSVALYATTGIENFMKSFLAAAWEDEEGIVQFLLKKEPQNIAIAPLVAIPRLYKDLVTGIQILRKDKMLPYILESRKAAGEQHVRANTLSESYAYWQGVSLLFQEEDRNDDLYLLVVKDKSKSDAKYFSTSMIEMCPYVWEQDLEELIAEEKNIEHVIQNEIKVARATTP